MRRRSQDRALDTLLRIAVWAVLVMAAASVAAVAAVAELFW